MYFMKYDDGCGRYTLQANGKVLKKRYNLAKEPKNIPQSIDIKPTHTMPVSSAEDDGTERKSVVKGKSVSVLVELDGRRTMKQQRKKNTQTKKKNTQQE